jgi:hypothetical protein
MRSGCRVAAAVLGAALQVVALWGQSPLEKDPIVTDRPDFTEASNVVPKSSIQLENGFGWTSDHGTRTLDLTESLLRLGVAARTELRVGVPGFLSAYGGKSGSGFGDVSVGVKQQIGPLPGGFDLAIIAALSLPTGAQNQSSHGYDPFLKLPWSRELGRGWSTGGMFSTFWYTEDRRRRFLWEPTLYIERQLTREWDAFVEYGGDYPTHAESRQVLHVGTAYKIKPHHQIDFHFGFGLSHATPQHFIAAGYSFRFDNVLFRK